MQEMENFKIRKVEFLNQNSLLGCHSTKIFFTPGRRIVFQQYRPIRDMVAGSTGTRNERLDAKLTLTTVLNADLGRQR